MKMELVSSYAKMINDGLCVISDLPEMYRQPVQDYINNPPEATVNNEIHTPVTAQEEINGALFLGNGEYEVPVSDTTYCEIKMDEVFQEYSSQGYPMPIKPIFGITMVENTFGKFTRTPVVNIANNQSGCVLAVKGEITNVVSGDKVLRVDLGISSGNYEAMRYTVYIKAE